MSPWAKTLANGEATVYLLHGEETFGTREAAAWLRAHIVPPGLEDFALDRFDGRDKPDPERIAQAARTLAMMAPRRLVLVSNAEVMFTQDAKSLAKLVGYVEDADPKACLVFHANGRVKKNGTLYKRVAKFGCVFESSLPRERELAGWTQGRARVRGRTLAGDAAALLVEAIGRDLFTLDGAVERLTLYVDGKETIQRAHVEETVAFTRARSVWDLVDALADRNASQALAHAHNLLGQGEPALRLMGMVTRQYRQLLIGRSVRAQGASTDEAAAAAGVPPFRAQTFARQLGNYKGRELVAALDRMAEADRALKGSKLPAELVFEGMLLDLCAR